MGNVLLDVIHNKGFAVDAVKIVFIGICDAPIPPQMYKDPLIFRHFAVEHDIGNLYPESLGELKLLLIELVQIVLVLIYGELPDWPPIK